MFAIDRVKKYRQSNGGKVTMSVHRL